MVGGHLAISAVIQKRTGKWWWLFIPIIIALHGFLDASTIYHDAPLVGLTVVPYIIFIILLKKKWRGLLRLTPSVLFAYLPDIIDYGRRWIMGLPPHPGTPFTKIDIHYWIQKPSWNWLGLYGAWWGILVEIGFVVISLIYLWFLLKKEPSE